MFISRRRSNFVLKREHGSEDAMSCPLLRVLYCMEGEFEHIITKIRLSFRVNNN